MELKKCPICGMPNDKSAKKCTECGHKFVAYFDEEEKKAAYKKESLLYRKKRKEEKEQYEKRTFASFWHIFGYYILNLILIIVLLKLGKLYSAMIDNFITKSLGMLSESGIDVEGVANSLQSIKFILGITIFQLLYNLFLFFRVDIKKILIWYNLLVILGLAIFMVASLLLSG